MRASRILIPVAAAAGPSLDPNFPADATVTEGSQASFNVVVTGSTGTLSYQWYENGSQVGTNSDTYTFTAALGQNGNTYYCDVTDDNGTTQSRIASLTVIAEGMSRLTPIRGR